MQDKARQLGVTSQDIASALNGVVGGTTVTQIRDDVYLIDVIGRAKPSERESIETIRQIQLPTANGTSVPLAAVANYRYEMEQPVVWRRSRQPTITVKASIADGVQPATVVSQMDKDVAAFRAAMPSGYSVTVGGTVEESANSAGVRSSAVVPLMLFVMATILMMQLQSFSAAFPGDRSGASRRSSAWWHRPCWRAAPRSALSPYLGS
jgi:multidrug efflux pump subunit AcrB